MEWLVFFLCNEGKRNLGLVFFQITWVREKCRVGLIWESSNFFCVWETGEQQAGRAVCNVNGWLSSVL